MIDHSSSQPDGNTSTKCLKSAPFPSLIRLTPPVLILLPLLLLLLSTPSFARRCLPMTSLTPAAASASASLSVVPEGVWIDGRARAKLREGGNNGCVRSRSANYNQLFEVRTYLVGGLPQWQQDFNGNFQSLASTSLSESETSPDN